MKTLVAMLSVGDRNHLTDYSVPRAAAWASRNHYDFTLVKQPLQNQEQPPHYGKLHVPRTYPDYDRYCIVDDDILISHHAPALPEIPADQIGLCMDAEQRNTHNPKVQWTGNTGFILAGKDSVDLLERAQQTPEDSSIWGYADQGALNSVAWEQDRVFKLDKRWNYAPVLEYFIQGRGWETWKNSKAYRLSFYSKMLLRWPHPVTKSIRESWGLHMIRAPYPRFFNTVLT